MCGLTIYVAVQTFKTGCYKTNSGFKIFFFVTHHSRESETVSGLDDN